MLDRLHGLIISTIINSRDALTGMSEQLEATFGVSRQNRLALDMLLASQGDVCKMFGKQCCTYIPNNTSPDDSF